MKNGILIMDKPLGMTSHDVVAILRKKLRTRKIGHSGTLDPIATGVLVMLVGKSTKLFSQFVHFDKEYEATLRFGITTSTGDVEGTVTQSQPTDHLTETVVRETFQRFIGGRQQIPPMVSAVKHQGKRLYELARKGIEVQRQARSIRIYDLKILKTDLPDVKFYLKCSKGTYVRRLAEEIGEELGCGAHILQIRRLSLGPFHIRDAVSLEDVHEGHLRDWKF